MTGQDLNYAKMMEGALIGVVRDALREVAASGLPGAHHFYITFRTDRDDVEIDDFLRERYPEEMTIVLQHQFWDLEVADDRFSVLLSFNDTPSKLSVPFAALTSFIDPSVKFGLQFGEKAGLATPARATGSDGQGAPGDDAVVVGRIDRKPEEPEERTASPGGPVAVSNERNGRDDNVGRVGARRSADDDDDGEDDDQSSSSADVVALDKFRKKK